MSSRFDLLPLLGVDYILIIVHRPNSDERDLAKRLGKI